MKHISLLSTFILVTTLTTVAQTRTSEGMSYSQPLQIDSSDNYIIGTMADKTNKKTYTTGLPFRATNFWTNVLIYNAGSNRTKKLFSISPISIAPVLSYFLPGIFGSQLTNVSSGIFQKSIVLLVKTDEYNKDGLIDEDDPLYLFVSSKSGDSLTQITPKDMTVTSWTVSKDSKMILVKLQKDKNGDKKFIDEDEIIYRIDMNDDISKIKISPISL